VVKIQAKIQAKYDKFVEDPDTAHIDETGHMDRLPGVF
jgi:hypothetical protein